MFQTTNQNPIDHWLVVYLPPWKMIEFVSWGDDIPNWMESHKIPWFQTTNQDHVGKTAPCLPSPNFTVFIGMEITFPVSGKNGIGFPTFTHRRFYTQPLSHTNSFTHNHFYAQECLHTNACMQRHFYTQTLLHTNVSTNTFARKCFFTQTRSHANTLIHDPFTHKHFYTQTLLHTDAFTHRLFYTQTLSHTNSFTHNHFYTQECLHTNACAQKHF